VVFNIKCDLPLLITENYAKINETIYFIFLKVGTGKCTQIYHKRNFLLRATLTPRIFKIFPYLPNASEVLMRHFLNTQYITFLILYIY
jgi:hypothetical protein